MMSELLQSEIPFVRNGSPFLSLAHCEPFLQGRLVYLTSRENAARQELLHGQAPVSYTHLDVYKRQPYPLVCTARSMVLVWTKVSNVSCSRVSSSKTGPREPTVREWS